MSVVLQEKQDTIDQVLDKIKQAIERGSYSEVGERGHRNDSSAVTEDVLELNEAIDSRQGDAASSSQLSSLVTNFTHRINDQASRRVVSEKEVEAIFREMLRPYLKSWLSSNLHAMVRPVLESEVKIILKKLFNVAL
jgi:cell pole-organizing protein PopZ